MGKIFIQLSKILLKTFSIYKKLAFGTVPRVQNWEILWQVPIIIWDGWNVALWWDQLGYFRKDHAKDRFKFVK